MNHNSEPKLQTTQDKDIIFTVNDGGSTKEALRIKGSTGRIETLLVGDLTVEGTSTVINTNTLTVELLIYGISDLALNTSFHSSRFRFTNFTKRSLRSLIDL